MHKKKLIFFILILKSYPWKQKKILKWEYYLSTTSKICHYLTYHVATFFTRDKFGPITFVYIRQKNKAYFFMYDESIAKKGQNEVISFIRYYFENLLQQGVKTFIFFLITVLRKIKIMQ